LKEIPRGHHLECMGRYLLLLSAFCVTAWPQNIEWYRQFKGAHGYGVAATGGSVYVASMSPGPALWKYDQSGNQLWERDLTTNGVGSGFGVAADATGAYIVGDATAIPGQPQIFDDGAFIRKYDPNGNVVWTRLFTVQEASGGATALGVALDASGVYMAGYADGTLPGQKASGAGEDIFVRKYDLNGNEMWTRQFGSGRATSIAVNSSGVYITGRGGPVVAGQTGSQFLRKYDASGNVIWTKLFGGYLQDYVRGVAVDTTGVYIAGSAQTNLPDKKKIDQNYDGFVIKFDFSGTQLWDAEWGNGNVDDAWAAATDGTGVYVVGETDRAFPGQLNYGSTDGYVRKYDPSGNLQWTKQFGATGADWGYGMAIDETGGYIVGSGNGNFPDQKFVGGNGVYLVRMTGIAPPTISLVANAFGDTPLLAPNTWVEIKGGALAPKTRIWADADFGTGLMPTNLDRVSVTVNGKAAYVYYISSTQIDILTPPDALPSTIQVQVTNGDTMSNILTVPAAPLSPSFFVFDGANITATHLDGTLLGPTNLYPGYSTPGKSGEQVIVYANGFGPTSSPVVSGIVTQSGSLNPLPVITVGNVPVKVSFAGLVSPGTFQFNIVLPTGLSGNQLITATYSGQATQKGVVLNMDSGGK
jgi:uncharacterized protein (TIGR03437 family)